MTTTIDRMVVEALGAGADSATALARRIGVSGGNVRAACQSLCRAGVLDYDPETGYFSARPAVSGGELTTDFTAFWVETLAPKFMRFRHILVGGLGRHSELCLADLPFAPGEWVLDVGCGFGDTAIQIADRVGPSGRVIGLDCAEPFLAAARADAQGRQNVEFVCADAESAVFAPVQDHVFSRFGTMFFTSPVPALRNIRTALKPGGTLAMIVWRARADNPWLETAKHVALRHLPAPGEDAATCGPGPFSMADPDMVRAQLEAAGFAETDFQRIDTPIMVGRDLADAIDFQLAIGPAGEICREAGDLFDAHRRAALIEDLTETLRPHLREDGVYLGSSSWLVTARNPR